MHRRKQSGGAAVPRLGGASQGCCSREQGGPLVETGCALGGGSVILVGGFVCPDSIVCRRLRPDGRLVAQVVPNRF